MGRARVFELIIELDDDLLIDLNKEDVQAKLIGRVNETEWLPVTFKYDNEHYDLLGEIDVMRSIGPINEIELKCTHGKLDKLVSMAKILLFDEAAGLYHEYTELYDDRNAALKAYSSFERSQEYWIQFTNNDKQPLSKCELLSVSLRGTGGQFTQSSEVELEEDFYIDQHVRPTYFVKTRHLGTITGLYIVANDLTASWYVEQVAVERLIRHSIDGETWEDQQVFKLNGPITPEQGTRGVQLGTFIEEKPVVKPAVKVATPKKLSRAASRASTIKAYQNPKFPGSVGRPYQTAARVNFDSVSMRSYGSTVADTANSDDTVTYHVLIQTITSTDFDPATAHVRVFGENGSTKRLKLARNKNSAMFNDYTVENFYTNGRPVGKISGLKMYFKNVKKSSKWKIKQLKLRQMDCKTDDDDDEFSLTMENVYLSSVDLQKSSIDFGEISGEGDENAAIFDVTEGNMLQATPNLAVESSTESIGMGSLASLSIAPSVESLNAQATSVKQVAKLEEHEEFISVRTSVDNGSVPEIKIVDSNNIAVEDSEGEGAAVTKKPSMKVGELKDSIGPSSTLKMSDSDCKYLVTTTTLDSYAADTDGPIYMQLFGEKGETTLQQLANPREKNIKQFRRGQRESYFMRGRDIGAVNGFLVQNKSNDNWIIEDISIEKLDINSEPIEGTLYQKPGLDPITVENGSFSTRDELIKKKFDHTNYDEDKIVELVKAKARAKMLRDNPNGTFYKVNVAMTNDASMPSQIDARAVLESSNNRLTEPVVIKMNPKKGMLYQYTVFGTKFDTVKNVQFIPDDYLQEQWFDYVEVVDGDDSFFMLPNKSHSNDRTIHFEAGYKYFIKITATEDFFYEPFVSLRLLGSRTTSPVLMEEDMFDKRHKDNVLQMIVNDEQVGRLMAIELSLNETKEPFSVQSIIIEQCNNVIRKNQFNSMKYNWEHAYEYNAAPKNVTGVHGTRFNLDNHTRLNRLESAESLDFSDFDFYIKFNQPQQIHNFFIGVHGTTTNHNYHLSKKDITSMGKYIKFSLDFHEDVTELVLDNPDKPDEIDFAYVVPRGRTANGNFFTVGTYDKANNKLHVKRGALYNIKIRVAEGKKWTGPVTVTMVGYGTKLAPFPLAENKKDEMLEGKTYLVEHTDLKINAIKQLLFDFKSQKYNGFIEKLKIEIGREVKEYRGQLEEVYEEMIIKDMTNIQDKKKKLTVDM